MIERYEKKRIRLNAPLRGMQAGTVTTIRVDKNGTPVDRYWRDRMADAKKDNCVEAVKGAMATKQVETEIKESTFKKHKGGKVDAG